MLGGSEFIVVVIAIVILFGASRIPQLGDSLGKGIRNFRNAVAGNDEEKALTDGEKKEETAEKKTDEKKEDTKKEDKDE